MGNDRFRRALAWAGAVALVLVAHPARGTGTTGATGRTGATADTGEPCADEPDLVCVSWSREVQGECPVAAHAECEWGCRPIGVGEGRYADGQCCYAVAGWIRDWNCCRC